MYEKKRYLERKRNQIKSRQFLLLFYFKTGRDFMNHVIRNTFLVLYIILSITVTWLLASLLIKNFNFSILVNGIFSGETAIIVPFFIILIATLIVTGLLLVVLMKRISKGGKGDKLGTSDFAKYKDFESFTGDDGLIIGKKFQMTAKKCFEHVVCVGPTGSGKSASFFIPNLLSLPSDASVVVTDPKGELLEKTGQHALNRGKEILIFSPYQSNSMKYNPLALCRNASEIRELAQILLVNGNAAVEQMTGTKAGGSEWNNMATPLLAAFLIYVKDLKAPKNTVSYAVNLIVENDIETLKILMMDAEPSAEKQFNIFMQSAESEKTASSIKTVLATNLQMFLDPMIEEITSENEIDPKVLRDKGVHLHLIVPEHKSAPMMPLMSCFFKQMMDHLVETKDGNNIFFLLDEFANIGVIPSIDVALATVRSRRMSIAIGIQSVNQIKQRYGQEAAVSIMDNLKTKFFLPGLSYESAEYASKMIGFKEISTTSTSFSKESTSHSVSKQKRELLTPDEIRRLEDETMVIITDNRNPFRDEQCRFYKDRKMLSLTEQVLDLDAFILDMRKKINNQAN